MRRITSKSRKAVTEARKLVNMATTDAKTNAKATLKRTNHELHWAGPLILMSLGLIWLLHGYGFLPKIISVPWLGGVLFLLGLARLLMYTFGYH